jgi:hypothetical protein
MLAAIGNIYKWALADYATWPFRFVMELIAWAASIGCAVTMALTLPHPPFIILYPLFMSQCMIFGWAAWTRKSFGMVCNYTLMVTIDVFAYIRLVLQLSN